MFLFRLEIDIDYEKFRTAETAVADEYDALMQVSDSFAATCLRNTP
jgi:hypothetical protein